MQLVYVSGRYSGEIDKNIADARKIAIELWERGFSVICPHLNTQNFEKDCSVSYETYIEGDLLMVERCDAVVMLPGWEQSVGACVERSHAISLGIEVVEYPHLPKDGHVSILPQAEKIVNGARRDDYGTPLDNHSRTARFWTLYTEHRFTAEDVCMLNILQKIARGMNKITRDTLVDISGYAENINLILSQRKAEEDG